MCSSANWPKISARSASQCKFTQIDAIYFTSLRTSFLTAVFFVSSFQRSRLAAYRCRTRDARVPRFAQFLGVPWLPEARGGTLNLGRAAPPPASSMTHLASAHLSPISPVCLSAISPIDIPTAALSKPFNPPVRFRQRAVRLAAFVTTLTVTTLSPLRGQYHSPIYSTIPTYSSPTSLSPA